ncbi:hypothetical protein PAMP_017250 [Pampus punctatissimus]
MDTNRFSKSGSNRSDSAEKVYFFSPEKRAVTAGTPTVSLRMLTAPVLTSAVTVRLQYRV